ncbi:MAG TPA: response regulator [Polyangiaceae bacterium]|nr:response regulator [Polyangiaceae bacterium]
MTTPIRVLLVEDNPGDAHLTRDTLEQSKILIQIAVTTDGEDALDYLLGRGDYVGVALPDLIVLDLNLPRLGGREVLAEMKRHEQLRGIPVVVLTSSDAEKDVVMSYQLGASCYVTKPVGLQAFQAIVKSIEGFWFTVVKFP